jgi:hypothetical protein
MRQDLRWCEGDPQRGHPARAKSELVLASSGT